ncbi:MAG: class I SAM-dependent methyltransferase [Acidobacteriia bacterium]|nr:class I SAM-dependent methyltransferase [Terriglobia bacterium]
MVTTAAIREHYDSLAFIYRTFWGDHIHHGLFVHAGETPEQAQVNLLDYCIALVNPGGSNVLDVGCGHGGTAIRLARKCDCRVLGLTLSEKQARLARQNAKFADAADTTTFVMQDAETYEYPASAFDLVWTMESSEHFQDKTRYLANVAITLRPGGKLLLAAWTGAMTSSRVREVARAFLCPELWTATHYQAAIEAAGMRIRRCEDLSAQVVQTWEICRRTAHAAKPVVSLLSESARDFVGGIDSILDAYRSGELTYTVIVAEK